MERLSTIKKSTICRSKLQVQAVGSQNHQIKPVFCAKPESNGQCSCFRSYFSICIRWVFFAGRRFRGMLLLSFLIITLAATYAFFGKLRYRIPAEPLMILMAAYGFYAVFEFSRLGWPERIRIINAKLWFGNPSL